MPHRPVAIIDIGSNSIRLVVYAGATRTPAVIFNEKVMAGLGKGVSATGALSEAAQERTLKALARFHLLTRQMDVRRTRVVATAAVRDATNGAEFLARVRGLGLKAEILSGENEGAMAGWGVLSAIPEADGVVADLGGGSLELVDVADGEVHDSVSLPLGVLRLPPMLKSGPAAFAKKVAKALDETGFPKLAKGRPLYLVGGSWRSLARIDMLNTDYPLPITHYYTMTPGRAAPLQKAVVNMGRSRSKSLPSLSLSRLPTLPHASHLMKAVVEQMRPSSLIVSAFGIREGLLYADLPPRIRRLDPLIEAARESGRGLGRFSEHGDVLDRWIAPLFHDDDEPHARLRLAACLLADVAWQAHPDFRAERGLEMALHGNWVGIDGPGRVMVAQALFSNFGGGGTPFPDLKVARLCTPAELERAARWGLAMRLGQRLSGGVAASLERSRLAMDNGTLRLELREEDSALYGESVERRLTTLGEAFRRPTEAVAV